MTKRNKKILVALSLLGFLASLPAAWAACRSAVEDVNGDGSKEIVLENDLIRVVVNPEKGGEIIGLSSKDGRLSDQAFRYNLLDTQDGRRGYGENQMFSKVPYAFIFEKNTPEEIVLRQYRQGTGESQFHTVHIRIAIRDGVSSVRCSYEVANAAEAMGKTTVCLWLHNWMTPRTGEATCYLTQDRGVASAVYTVDKGAGRDSLSAEQAPRGWMAVKAGAENTGGAGVAFAMDWRYLQSPGWGLYFWYVKEYVTPEWRYIPVEVDNGKSFTTEFEIMPFAGLSRVDHAGQGLVFDTGLDTIVAGAEARTMKIVFDRSRSIQVRLGVRPVKKPGDEPPHAFQPVTETTVSGAAFQVAEVPYAIKGLAEGDYVLQCLVMEAGRTNVNFERRFDIGKAFTNSVYVYRPVEKRMESALAKQKTYFPYAPSRKIVTPHFDWYQPNYGGKLRVLFLGNYGASREVVELAQVLDMDYTAPCIHPDDWAAICDPVSKKVAWGPDPMEYLKHLPDCVGPDRKYDVIILRNLSVGDYRNMPVDFKKRIVDLVKSGTGLVALGEPLPDWGAIWDMFNEVKNNEDLSKDLSGDGTVAYPNLQLKSDKMTGLIARKIVICGQYGAGRVIFDLSGPNANALLNAQGAPLAELANWAAGKDAPVTLESIRLADPNLTWETWDRQQVQAVVKAGSDLGSATAELSWYSEKPAQRFQKFYRNGKPRTYQPAWEAVSTNSIPCEIKAGRNVWQWPAAPVRAGAGRMHLRLLKDGKVLKSAALDFAVAPAVVVADIQLEQDILKPGEAFQGQVVLVNKGLKAHDAVCAVRGYDIYDRDFYQKEVMVNLAPGATSSVPVAGVSGAPVSVLQLIRADLREAGRPMSADLAEFTVPSLKNRFDDYLAFSWEHANGEPVMRLKALKELGFDACYIPFWDDSNAIETTYSYNIEKTHTILETGLRLYICNIGRSLSDSQTGARLVRKMSFSDPAYLAKERERLGAFAALGARYGAYAYNLADEPSLGKHEGGNQFDWSQWSRDNFKLWLKQHYETIEALNAEWDTKYAGFDDVQPAVESEVCAKANLAPWQDFRAHMNHEVAKMYKNDREALLGPDPGALMGPCGVGDGHPYAGFDWWELAGICDYVPAYGAVGVLRSLTPAGKFTSYQGYKSGYLPLWDGAWSGFFEGWQGYAYWTESIYFKADYTLAEAHARPIREILATFRNGTGKLWMETARQDQDIVLHYSQPSIHTTWMMKYWQKEIGNGLQFYRDNRWSMEKAVTDSALDASYMAYGQIEQGQLAVRKPRVLILPLSISMSEKEVEAVKRYVKEGGVLIADLSCALRDEHGKPYPKAMLDDVFGIEREAGYKDTVALQRGRLAGQAGEVALYVEPGVRPVSAKPYTRLLTTTNSTEGVPLVMVNAYGKGKGIYLRFTGQYNQCRQLKPQLTRLYRDIFENVAGIKGRYQVASDGAPLPGQTLVHTYGDAAYFGFYQDLGFALAPEQAAADAEESDIKSGTRSATFTLPARRHVYDILDGKYLGETDRFPIQVVPGRGRLYASLPYKVTGIDVTLAQQAKPGDILLLKFALRKEGAGKGMHVYHIEVLDPDGRVMEYHTSNLAAPDGVAAAVIQFPLNAGLGRYTIKARDVASGMQASALVRVGK